MEALKEHISLETLISSVKFLKITHWENFEKWKAGNKIITVMWKMCIFYMVKGGVGWWSHAVREFGGLRNVQMGDCVCPSVRVINSVSHGETNKWLLYRTNIV